MAETAAEISAELVILREARRKLAKGERVKDVWRAGRRIVYAEVTLDQLNKTIQMRERDLEAAEAAEGGRSRRRAIGLAWTN